VKTYRSHICIGIAVLVASFSRAIADPLKVYIMAGQSNMEGHAHVRTFDHIGMDPQTAPLLAKMRNADGTPRVCEKVWISYLTGDGTVKEGKLTAGFGALKGGPKIGPEFTFGITMEESLDAPILIIKTAWGGKSLHTDFRPPSAGPYVFSGQQLAAWKEAGKDIDEIKAKKAEATGHYYRLMIEHVKNVLADIKRVYPDYSDKDGYELAGFVWFQGWNDMVDRSTYPDRGKPGGYDRYSEALAHFIRDVRKDLGAPAMPFVIGVMGTGGDLDRKPPTRYTPIHRSFREAMAAPASLAEFKGNVIAVLTEKSWDHQLGELDARWGKVKQKSRELSKDASLNKEQQKADLDKYVAELFTPEEKKIREAGISNFGFHYMGSAKIFARIGEAFAKALLECD